MLDKTNDLFDHLDSNTNEWEVDSNRLNRLKEEYKRDRHVKHPSSSSSSSSSLRNSLLNNGSEETSSDQRTFNDDERSNSFSDDCFSL